MGEKKRVGMSAGQGCLWIFALLFIGFVVMAALGKKENPPAAPLPTPIPTDTPGPTLTPSLTPLPRTATAEAIAATATFVAQYLPIKEQELVNYANRHAGETVIVWGSVFNIVDDTTIQIHLRDTGEAAVIVSADPVTVYKGDTITVYGTVGGFYTGTNAFGADIKQPELDDAVIVGPAH